MDDRIAASCAAPAGAEAVWVRETLFGRWFPGTEIWRRLQRVLRPGGLLLVAESCRSFIETGLVRALFRHPRESRRTADGYLGLVRSAGFRVDDRDVATSSPWWSRRDLDLLRHLGHLDRRRPSRAEEPTEVLCVGVKVS